MIDKVAFACLYLPDAKLAEYIDRLTADLVGKGSLDGLLLTGKGPIILGICICNQRGVIDSYVPVHIKWQQTSKETIGDANADIQCKLTLEIVS